MEKPVPLAVTLNVKGSSRAEAERNYSLVEGIGIKLDYQVGCELVKVARIINEKKYLLHFKVASDGESDLSFNFAE